MIRTTAMLTTLLVLGAGAWSLDAHADPVAGTWKSTSGATIIIPETNNDVFPVLRIDSAGSQAFGARWESGREGVQFTYVSGNQTNIATYDSRDGRIYAGVGSDRNAWTTAGAYRSEWGMAGAWRSSTGNRWYIVPVGYDIHLVLAPKGQPVVYLRGSWVEGRVGKQFSYTDQGVTSWVNVFAETPKELQIVDQAGTAVATWTKHHGFAAGGEAARTPAPKPAGWSKTDTFDSWVAGYHFTKVTFSNPSDCLLRAELSYDSPSASPANFQAKLDLTDTYMFTEVWSEAAAGVRVYTYTSDTAKDGCWGKRPNAVTRLYVVGCFEAGCTPTGLPQ